MIKNMRQIVLSSAIVLSLAASPAAFSKPDSGTQSGTTYTFNYNLNLNLPVATVPGGSPPAYIWANAINDNGTIAGQYTDYTTYYGFVTNPGLPASVIYYGAEAGAYGTNQPADNFSFNIQSIDSVGDILGTVSPSEAGSWFYSKKSDYGCSNSAVVTCVNPYGPNQPTQLLLGPGNSQNVNFASLTDTGKIIGSAAPGIGEGYTYLFDYDTNSRKYTIVDLPFIAAKACGATQGQIAVTVNAASSKGTWVAGTYSQMNGTTGAFAYNIKTQEYIPFNSQTPSSGQVFVGGVNEHGVVVGTINAPAPLGFYGYIYNASIKTFISNNFLDPETQQNANNPSNTYNFWLTDINDNGVILGISPIVNTTSTATWYGQPFQPNYVFTATPNMQK